MEPEKLGTRKLIINEPGSGVYVLEGDTEYLPDRKSYRLIAENGEYIVNEDLVMIVKPVKW